MLKKCPPTVHLQPEVQASKWRKKQERKKMGTSKEKKASELEESEQEQQQEQEVKAEEVIFLNYQMKNTGGWFDNPNWIQWWILKLSDINSAFQLPIRERGVSLLFNTGQRKLFLVLLLIVIIFGVESINAFSGWRRYKFRSPSCAVVCSRSSLLS